MGEQDFMQLAGISAVIGAGWSHGVLPALLEGPPASAAALAARLGLDPGATGLVLEALEAFGAATHDGEAWTASDALRRQAAQWPGGMAAMAALWGHVPRFLKDGTPFRRMDGAAGDRQAAYADVVASLGKMFGPAAADLAARLPDLPREGAEILDVGAGSGVWSLAMAERRADARVTAFDLPGVLPNFEARAASLGLSDRVATLAGDFNELALPAATYDRVVLANVLHLEPAASAATLLRRAAGALRPGGQLVVIDVLGGGEPHLDRGRTLYALHLAMRTDKGRNHPRAEIEGWCREAGLTPEGLVVSSAPPAAMAALVASR